MPSKVKAKKKIEENSGNEKLLNEIEALSKSLYLDKAGTGILKSTVSSRSKSEGRTYLSEPKSKSKDENDEAVQKDKKSIWSWKSLKAITNVRSRRFKCCFSLDVNSIEGLPPSFEGLRLCVHWKRWDGEVVTRPARVFQGIAEFEERLTHVCTVYGRRGSHHVVKYEAKYFFLYASVLEAPRIDLGKHQVDLTRLLPVTLGELEKEKSSGKWTTSYNLLGKAKGAAINISFGYSILENIGSTTHRGGAPGFLQNSRSTAKSTRQPSPSSDGNRIRQAGRLPKRPTALSRSVEDIKDLHEVLPNSRPELSDSIYMEYQKPDDEKFTISIDHKPEVDVLSRKYDLLIADTCIGSGEGNFEKECEVDDFSIAESCLELSLKEGLKVEEKAGGGFPGDSLDIEVQDITSKVAPRGDTECYFPVKDIFRQAVAPVVNDDNSIKREICTNGLLMEELEPKLKNVSDLLKEELDCPGDEREIPNEHSCLQDERRSKSGGNLEDEIISKCNRKGKSLSWDEITEAVASEFLDLLAVEPNPYDLSSESDPESPRELLLRQFEKDALAQGCLLFNFCIEGDKTDIGSDNLREPSWGNFSDDFDHSSMLVERGTEDATCKTMASMLEDLETEALMHDWGLNEDPFLCSSSNSFNGFGSPIELPPEDPFQLPPLGDGLGPYFQTKKGGFVRSMNPTHFRTAKSDGGLIMQVSSPVVVPAEMGAGIMEIVQHLASVGIEKLSKQAGKLMPLEDITGKTMQQMAWEATTDLEASDRQPLFQQSEVPKNLSDGEQIYKEKASNSRSNMFESSFSGNKMDSEYVSLEDLAPLAMDQIEALSIEGLRIQSGMSDEDAPSNISAQSISEFSRLTGKTVNIGGSLVMEGAGGLQLLDVKDHFEDVDGLMGLSLTLDEWMRLDSGEFDDEDQISEQTSRILAAHHATCSDLFCGKSNEHKRQGKGANKKCGLLGNKFTVALMVQLHDPLQNYEPVGTPLLALVQVERVFVPTKPKIYSTVSELRNRNEEDEGYEPAKMNFKESKEDRILEDESSPQFKIIEVHVAGLKAESGKKKLWGSTTQQQSGSRWLLANGMGKKNKHPLMKSKAVGKTTSPSSPSLTSVQPGDILWSISSRVHGTGSHWKELAALNPHIRNPNIVLPNEAFRFG